MIHIEAAYKNIVEARYRTYNDNQHLQGVFSNISDFFKQDAKFGMLMIGGVGNGKTTMMRAIKQLVDYIKFTDSAGRVIKMQIQDTNQLSRLCKDDYKAFREIMRTTVLGIDDLGREPVAINDYGTILNPMVELLQYRYDEQLPTFITSNLDAKALLDRYGERVADRLREMMDIVTFDWSSFRGETR